MYCVMVRSRAANYHHDLTTLQRIVSKMNEKYEAALMMATHFAYGCDIV